MKLPREWTEGLKRSSTTLTANSTKLVARIDMSEDVAGKGLCPECGSPMKEVEANGIPCLCCFEHRIVLPKKNG